MSLFHMQIVFLEWWST